MVDEQAKPKAPAGWYPHPSMVETKRYWDGQVWTDHIAPAESNAGGPSGYAPRTAPASAYVPLQQPQQDDKGLITAGVLTAIFIPFIGFIIGVALLFRGKAGPGVGILILSVIAFAFWFEALQPDPVVTYYGN